MVLSIPLGRTERIGWPALGEAEGRHPHFRCCFATRHGSHAQSPDLAALPAHPRGHVDSSVKQPGGSCPASTPIYCSERQSRARSRMLSDAYCCRVAPGDFGYVGQPAKFVVTIADHGRWMARSSGPSEVRRCRRERAGRRRHLFGSPQAQPAAHQTEQSASPRESSTHVCLRQGVGTSEKLWCRPSLALRANALLDDLSGWRLHAQE
jgi:hypothetical protein